MDPHTIALPAVPAPPTGWAVRSVHALQRLRHWVPIRTLGERHRTQVRSHLLALDGPDRQRRFGHSLSDERLRAYVEQLDFRRDQVFGTFDRQLHLVALGHLALDAGEGELGLSVLARSRGRGLGRRLFGHAVTHARNRGVHTLHIHLARDNAAMLAIVQRAGAQLAFDGNDALATLALAGENLGSQLDELLSERAAALDFRLKVRTLRVPAPSRGAGPPPFD